MLITIDIDDTQPPFAQLIAQVKDAVAGGSLVAGDALPSIRQLANDLDLNNKTVAKAYRLLERDHIVQTKGYRGTFVHPDALANSSVDLNGEIMKSLQATIDEFRQAGVTDAEIRNAFSAVMSDRGDRP